MPFVPLSVNTSLSQIRAMVRRESGANNAQEFNPPMTDLILNDIVQDALMRVRQKGSKFLDTQYNTDQSVVVGSETATESFFDLSALGIHDVNRLKAKHATYGVIPVLPEGEYNTHVSLRSASGLKNALFGKLTNATTTTSLSLIVYRGSSITTLTPILLTYPRDPVKQTTDAGKIDLPDRYVPIATTVAALMVKGIITGAQIAQTDSMIDSYLKTAFSQFGLQVNPVNN